MDNTDTTKESQKPLREAAPIMLGHVLEIMEESGQVDYYERRAQPAKVNGTLHTVTAAQGSEVRHDDSQDIYLCYFEADEISDPEDVMRYYKAILQIPIAEQCRGDNDPDLPWHNGTSLAV
ncbi:hypothetical protein KEM54_002703 [Ascosphaera aggregata]|nr:hypothetical protein KEM54_002703 [Ascosphaera aggregata]